MKTISNSREEFNSAMNPYVAVIVQTEHEPFLDEFFSGNGLILPDGRINYTPPAWVGVEYSAYFMGAYGGEKPEKWREEKIPEINPFEKYLICDDYSNEGETFEVAMMRLVEKGVKLDNIWCISRGGNKEIKAIILDKGTEWHKYRLRQKNLIRMTLENLGFAFPSLAVS